ncbi:Mucin-associated surface protein (MASP) [Trypanosoma cruzi]|uniref:Mucin-associated surface protein (MASP) n=1 Tax=Trypanosoma cruzi TaxID=5693 RepID=A0A2V2W7C1_TRYCR|nr:Mucin-associated surface protein (MASP) [Trypanosoma cruzi]
MAMMMTGRVLLVCALCVLWCSAYCRCTEEESVSLSRSGIGDSRTGSGVSGENGVKTDKTRTMKTASEGDSHPSERDVSDGGSFDQATPDKSMCKEKNDGSTVKPLTTDGEVLVDSQETVATHLKGTDTDLADPNINQNHKNPKAIDGIDTQLPDAPAAPKAQPSPPTVPTANKTVNSKEELTAEETPEHSRATRNPNEGSETKNPTDQALKPDAGGIDTLASEDASSPSIDDAATSEATANTARVGSPIASLNNTDGKNEGSGDGDSPTPSPSAAEPETITTAKPTTRDVSHPNKNGIVTFTGEKNAPTTNPKSATEGKETADVESDSSTAVSHTASPLLLLLLVVACAAAAAVVAA